MPSKKKKYNSRFPPARIKKIMQTDEDVGKVAATVPVIISRALELFIESLILKTNETTVARNAKTLTTTHIKQTIERERQFDFLRELVSTLPDHQVEEEDTSSSLDAKKPRGTRGQRKSSDGTPGEKRKDRQSSSESSETNGGNEEDDEETETDEDTCLRTEQMPSSSTAPPYTNHLAADLNVPPYNTHFVPPHIPTAQVPSNSLPYSMNQTTDNPSHQAVVPGGTASPVVNDEDYDT